MISSVVLAQVFGIYLAVMGISLLFNPKYYNEAAADLFAHKGVLLLSAIMTLILGIILVLSHNLWVNDWRVIVTMLCWLTFIKGVVRVVFPCFDQKWKTCYDKCCIIFSGLFCLGLGGVLLYFGFKNLLL